MVSTSGSGSDSSNASFHPGRCVVLALRLAPFFMNPTDFTQDFVKNYGEMCTAGGSFLAFGTLTVPCHAMTEGQPANRQDAVTNPHIFSAGSGCQKAREAQGLLAFPWLSTRQLPLLPAPPRSCSYQHSPANAPAGQRNGTAHHSWLTGLILTGAEPATEGHQPHGRPSASLQTHTGVSQPHSTQWQAHSVKSVANPTLLLSSVTMFGLIGAVGPSPMHAVCDLFNASHRSLCGAACCLQHLMWSPRVAYIC